MVKRRKPPKKVEIRLETTLFDIDSTNSKLQAWRTQTNKVLEEAAEVFAAMRRFENFHISDDIEQVGAKWDVLDEIADTIQAMFNLAYKLDFTEYDIEEAMIRCELKNKERGRLN